MTEGLQQIQLNFLSASSLIYYLYNQGKTCTYVQKKLRLILMMSYF